MRSSTWPALPEPAHFPTSLTVLPTHPVPTGLPVAFPARPLPAAAPLLARHAPWAMRLPARCFGPRVAAAAPSGRVLSTASLSGSSPWMLAHWDGILVHTLPPPQGQARFCRRKAVKSQANGSENTTRKAVRTQAKGSENTCSNKCLCLTCAL